MRETLRGLCTTCCTNCCTRRLNLSNRRCFTEEKYEKQRQLGEFDTIQNEDFTNA